MALSVLKDGDKGRFIIDRHKYDARQRPVPPRKARLTGRCRHRHRFQPRLMRMISIAAFPAAGFKYAALAAAGFKYAAFPAAGIQ
jgi:hypothetical protein